jgi:pimeloyl-ACP methyl ester carboxylesterase
MGWTDRFVERDAARLAVRDYGGEGLPVLLLHALGGNVCAWDRVAPRLASQFRVAAFDSRGHGLTDTTSDYSLTAHLEDIDAVRDALGMGPTLLVGHSLGAVISVAYACRRADAVGAINVDGMFMDPAAFERELGIDREIEQQRQDASLASEWLFQGNAQEVEEWLSEQRRGWDKWLDELDADPTHVGGSAFMESFDSLEPMLRRQLNEIAPGAYERRPNQVDWVHLRSDLLDPMWEGVSALYDLLETPLLVIVARHFYPPEGVSLAQVQAVQKRWLDRLRDRHPEAGVEWVESSHNVPLVLPALLSGMIAAFAQRLERPRSVGPNTGHAPKRVRPPFAGSTHKER